jgi:hypothetical protein
LGAPIGLFLTLRGAHAVFDDLRNNTVGKPKASPFTLPSGSIHNIFHPSDPIAYRIEPLLLAQGTKDLPTPLYLTREGQGVRLHVKAMQLGDEIRKSIAERTSSITSFSFMKSITEQAQTLLHERGQVLDSSAKDQSNNEEKEVGPLRFPLAGRNDRLDYQLQPRVIDNEYVSAVLAHSSYFTNTDVIDYVIDLTTRSKLEQLHDVIDLTHIDEEGKDAAGTSKKII